MQVSVSPIQFLFSALHYLLYNSSIDGNYEIGPYFIRSSISTMKLTNVWADTKLGKIRGITQLARDGEPYGLFRGIPYAKAPVGELRYEPPKQHEGWKDVLDATCFRSQCSQINMITRTVTGSEDCLFLNIATRKSYTAKDLPIKREDLRPVMFFIHGGLFMSGGANFFGSKYFMDEDIVLVTINYRLNSFGFFNSGDGVVPGNMGMKDQTYALKWVRDNIEYFNGDPNRVTIFGESAGGASVHLHTLSPLSDGLFFAAISQSGTALSPWGHVDYPEIQAKEYGEGLGCPTQDSKEMVACLKKLPAETVTKYHLGYINSQSEGKQALFGPTVDSGPDLPENKFLPAKPLELLRTNRVSSKPWINGVNSGDGLVYLIPVLRNETVRKMLADNWEHYAPALLAYQNLTEPEKSTVSTELSSYYLHNEIGIGHDHINDTGTMFSDRGFFLDSHDVAVMQAQVAPTYVYYYTYEGVFAMGNLLFYRTPLPLPSDWNYMVGGGMVWILSVIMNRRSQRRNMDIFHGDEMVLLFNIPLVRREVIKTDQDYEFSKKMISLFVSFAETGVPDPSNAGEHVAWDPVPKDTIETDPTAPLQRLNLDKQFQMIDEPFNERMQFWRRHSISYLNETGWRAYKDEPNIRFNPYYPHHNEYDPNHYYKYNRHYHR